MWNRPWRYAEGWMICTGLCVTGVVLQWMLGRMDTGLFRYPTNVVCGLIYLVVLVSVYWSGRKYKVLRWLSGLEASFTSTASLLAWVILMGLTRQVPVAEDVSGSFLSRLGFRQMTESWPFILLFCYFLSVIGWVTLHRLEHFRWKDIPFYLNHVGLFLTLWAAILGSGDLHRLRMQVNQEAAEWRATDENCQLVELPLAIELKQFTIDEYPPKLVILDNVTGKALPENHPIHVLVEATPFSGHLMDWQLDVTAYLPMAACVASKDTVNFVAFHSEGATTALYVKARNSKDGTLREGWVSSGNYMFPYAALSLNEAEVLVMPEREPRRFASQVVVYTKDKQRIEALIEVNKPLSVEGWKIYQLSYDETMGKWSRTSVFELVSDPWLPFVYAGILMMICGSICLFVNAPKSKEE